MSVLSGAKQPLNNQRSAVTTRSGTNSRHTAKRLMPQMPAAALDFFRGLFHRKEGDMNEATLRRAIAKEYRCSCQYGTCRNCDRKVWDMRPQG